MNWVWFPLKQIGRWAARRHGFIDPALLLAKLESFGQPSEVQQPLELLRAGVVMHARGLVNARVIQHNLDWVWPLWVERQFDPADEAFIPRAFSITHVNLSHRSWTALGLPRCKYFPLVDPHGLLTPGFDGWSIDLWILRPDGSGIVPSRSRDVTQTLILDQRGWAVRTVVRDRELALTSEAWCEPNAGIPTLVQTITAVGGPADALGVAIRPYNPEGVSFVETIDVDRDAATLSINRIDTVQLSERPTAWLFSTFERGDSYTAVARRAGSKPAAVGGDSGAWCRVGLASGVARYDLDGGVRHIIVRVPLAAAPVEPLPDTWSSALAGQCQIDFGDERLNLLYAAAVRSLLLLAPADIYPGPFTYRRFWFRDAGFMMHALVSVGLSTPVERCIDRFELRQTSEGYLASQDGEWDSNGVALWAIDRYCALAHRQPKAEWFEMIRGAAEWIIAKRLPTKGDARHRGLLPAGFSAEHLGPNDFYFWDDYWGVAGLAAAGALFERFGHPGLARRYREAADDFSRAIERAVASVAATLPQPAIPASPYRRMDSGAIGSIVGAYPLELIEPHDPRLDGTVTYLLDRCCRAGAFFQDMIHSGLNPYLTLHLAAVLVRRNDVRAHVLFHRVSELASATGQWPEAVHPRTGGGCMGDGHHGWAAAEWAIYCRHMFVREDRGMLHLASGIPIDWMRRRSRLRCDAAPTTWGLVSVELESDGRAATVRWRGDWHGAPPPIEVGFLGQQRLGVAAETNEVVIECSAEDGGAA